MLSAPAQPSEQDLLRVASLLADGSKIAILAGAGARHARKELLEVAEALAAPIVKTLSGKDTVPDDSPYTTGGIGLLGTKPSEDLMEEIDTLLMVGTNFPYTKHLPEPGKVRVAQIEADPVRAGARVPTEVPVVGDAKLALQGLLPLLKPRSDTRFLQKYQKAMGKWRENMTALQNPKRDPIAPQYVVSVLDELAANDSVLTCDSGTIATWAARHWHIRGGREFFLSGNLATMAPGMPYAIGIQHAMPGRQVIAYVGDGGFAMLMAEFITAIKHKLPVKIVINNNNSLGQILWEQMVLGYPEYGVRQPEPFVDYAALATANGALGIKVERARDVHKAVQRALSHHGPALVDVNVNPDEPPLPGKVEYDQAKKFAQAFLKASRARPRSRPRCSVTRSTSSRAEPHRQGSAPGTSGGAALCCRSAGVAPRAGRQAAMPLTSWRAGRPAQLPGVPHLHEGLGARRGARGDGPAALQFRVELGAEQDRGVGEPQPDQEDDHAGDAAVNLVVVAEVGHVQGEQPRGGQPDTNGDHGAGDDPAQPLPGVRAGPVQHADHQADQDRPAPAIWRCPTW